MACPLAFERVWVDKYQYNDAEKKHYEQLSGVSHHNLINCESYASSTLLFLGLLLNTENERRYCGENYLSRYISIYAIELKDIVVV